MRKTVQTMDGAVFVAGKSKDNLQYLVQYIQSLYRTELQHFEDNNDRILRRFFWLTVKVVQVCCVRLAYILHQATRSRGYTGKTRTGGF